MGENIFSIFNCKYYENRFCVFDAQNQFNLVLIFDVLFLHSIITLFIARLFAVKNEQRCNTAPV